PPSPPLPAQQSAKDGPAFEKPLEAEAVKSFGLSKKARMGHLGAGGRPLRQMNAQRPRKSRAHVYSQPPRRYKFGNPGLTSWHLAPRHLKRQSERRQNRSRTI